MTDKDLDRNAILETCAKIADSEGSFSSADKRFGPVNRGRNKAASNIAAAIRALKVGE